MATLSTRTSRIESKMCSANPFDDINRSSNIIGHKARAISAYDRIHFLERRKMIEFAELERAKRIKLKHAEADMRQMKKMQQNYKSQIKHRNFRFHDFTPFHDSSLQSRLKTYNLIAQRNKTKNGTTKRPSTAPETFYQDHLYQLNKDNILTLKNRMDKLLKSIDDLNNNTNPFKLRSQSVSASNKIVKSESNS
jgi:hypothetical protein